MTSRPQPDSRDTYARFVPLTTRWMDNDAYGHLNNVVYYSLFDTAVNSLLIEAGALDIHAGATIGLVIETRCNYFSSIAFPDTVHAGLRLLHLGSSSVRYEIGLFREDAPQASAVGEFVHVYVDRASQRPVAIPETVRNLLSSLR